LAVSRCPMSLIMMLGNIYVLHTLTQWQKESKTYHDLLGSNTSALQDNPTQVYTRKTMTHGQ
jgi:hypothetical protein